MEQPPFRPPWLCSFWKVEQKTLVREEEEELEDSVVNLCLAGNGNRRALASQRAPPRARSGLFIGSLSSPTLRLVPARGRNYTLDRI